LGRFLKSLLAVAAMTLSGFAQAGMAFEVGMSREFFVTPGGSVTLSYQFRNTGDVNFVFQDKDSNCIDSSVWCLDWYGLSVGDDHETAPFGLNVTILQEAMRSAHDGLVIAPGEVVSFDFAEFTVPDLTVGSRASFRFSNAYELSFGTSPLSSLYGGLSLHGTNLPDFGSGTLFDVVVSDTSGSTAPIFSEACIWNRSTDSKVSGPDACGTSDVPEPSTFTLTFAALLAIRFAFMRRRNPATC
jgi:hypothetical protein